jgi:hypothetical protein
MNRLHVALGLASMIATPALGDLVPPSVRCQTAKIWIAGRYVARHPRCRTAACTAGWARAMTRSFADLERNGSCLTSDDAARLQDMVREFEAMLAAMLRRRERPCARLFVAATARLAAVRIRSQRPVWPPRDRPFPDEWHDAFDRFDRDRVAAKALHGCRSIILGSKLADPAWRVEQQVVRALLPPEVATGLRVDLPPGWHLHDVAPGRAGFVTFAEYGHGGFMPQGGADLDVYVTNKSVDEWLERWHDGESVEHVTIDGADGVRTTTTFEEENQRRLDILVPGKPFGIALSASWYVGDDHHPDDVEQMIRAARFFGYAEPVRRIDEAK